MSTSPRSSNEEVWAPGYDLPDLTLNSTLLELLDPGFDRSWSLEDSNAKVEYVDPGTISISWPGAEEEKSHSLISIHIVARPAGGARIGIWKSEPVESDTPPTPPAQ